MSVTHPVGIRNGIADYVCGSLVTGPGVDSPYINFRTSGGTFIVGCTFGNPAFGSAAAGIATANPITPGTATGAGTISKFDTSIYTAADAGFAGTVTLSGGGGDITLTTLDLGIGDQLQIDSLTYEACP